MLFSQTYKQTGAATNRRRAKRDPLVLMVELCDDNPQLSKESIIKKWKQKCRADTAYDDAVYDYAGANMWSQLARNRPIAQPIRTREQYESQRAEAAAFVKSKADQLTLMDLVLPNGKKIRHCTFAEVGKYGGWLKLLATKGKPSEIVGDKLTESDLQLIR